MNSKISIIIPCRNAELYLEECINSIFVQDYPVQNIEVIFAYDISTDNTREILSRYENQYPENIMIIDFPEAIENPGLARNIALSYASGEYITFIDADDVVSNTYLSSLYKLLTENNLDYVTCSYELFDEKGHISSDISADRIFNMTDISDKREYLLNAGSHTCAWGRLYRADFIKSNNFQFADDIHIAEDMFFIHQCMMSASMVGLSSEVLYHYRVKSDSIFHNQSSNNALDICVCMERLCDLFASSGQLWDVYDEYSAIYYVKAVEELDNYINAHDIALNQIDFLWKYVRNTVQIYFPDIRINKYLPKDADLLLATKLNLPEISIIVPVHNAEKTINRCISSILSQTYDNLEIVLVDDCSTDSTPILLNEWASNYPNKINVIKTSQNLGAGGARNQGIASALGVYIGFVDADDYINSNMYEKLLTKALTDDYDIVDCGFYNEANDTAIIYTSDELSGVLNSSQRASLIASGGYIWSKLFKRSFINDDAFIMRDNCILEDSDFLTLAFAKAKSIGNVKEILYFYCNQEDSLSKENDPYAYHTNITSAIMAIYDKCHSLSNYEGIRSGVEYEMLQMYIWGILNIINNKSKLNSSKEKEMIDELRELRMNVIKDKSDVCYENPFVISKIPKTNIEIAMAVDHGE